MTVESREKQEMQVQGEKLESKQLNQLGNNLNDQKQQKANIVDPYIKEYQQGSGKHEQNRSRWTGDL